MLDTYQQQRMLKHHCEQSHLAFSRYYFTKRMGSKMIIAPHHEALVNALQMVVDGLTSRLIITLPPGYTKTEFASIMMMARGLALTKGRARFMHLSYSASLALLNSSTARGIIKGTDFQSKWPMALRDDSDSKGMWWTEHGGGVYATSTGGQVTGFRAGHMDHTPEIFTGALIVDDPVKPDDAYSETVRDGINDRYNETIKSRLAIENVPIILIMQRIHYQDLAGYLLRGGSGEKWHHLNMPVIIDNNLKYPEENTHGIPLEHGLKDGWLWPFKHNASHEIALRSHKRTWHAQYMQAPKRFDEEGALWTEKMIAFAKDRKYPWKIKRTIIAVDPAVSDEEGNDDTGIVACSGYSDEDFTIDGDYTMNDTTDTWAEKVIEVYNRHEADAVVVEVNNGGALIKNVLRLKKFKGRIIEVHASKGKYARAEPISALYEQGKVKHEAKFPDGQLYDLETEIMEYVPATAKRSPNRLDALVWGLTELSDPTRSAGGFGW
jgi:hypothetical protein